MDHHEINPKYTGERLVPGPRILKPTRIENLARFKFLSERAQGAWILDLGCGTGEGSAYLAKNLSWHVLGVDISIEALTIAHRLYQNSNVSFIQMNVESLAFPDRSFDTILSIEVIEHLSNPVFYLEEAIRILKPGGRFMLTTPNKLLSSPKNINIWPEHSVEYRPDQLKDLLLSFFPTVELWGESIPIYERHPIRKLFRKLAPTIKPILPRWLRIRALHMLQTAIQPNIRIDDIFFSKENIEELPTLLAICKK